ncbi:MAG TPA: carboxypeptidase-like regulatory domain-containing protein [Streptosporangiaceae bacterium]|nr:carboxypeptidase-like regulatory domain-containing protein [Streptosporangiaceae bacterium]
MAAKPRAAGTGAAARGAHLAGRRPLPRLVTHFLRGGLGVLGSQRHDHGNDRRTPAGGHGGGARTAVRELPGARFAPAAADGAGKPRNLVAPGVRAGGGAVPGEAGPGSGLPARVRRDAGNGCIPAGGQDGPGGQGAVHGHDTVNGQPAAGIAGIVRDDAGRPLPGALLTATATDGRQVARERSDENGNFWLAGFGPGMLTLVVTARGHQPAAAVIRVRAGAIIDREFVLAPAVGPAGTGPGGAQRAGRPEVRGVVRAPGGAPVPGILVTAATMAGDIVASAVTGEHGTYRLTGLGDGEHVLAASGHSPAVAAVSVGAGSTAEITLRIGSGPGGPPAVPLSPPGPPGQAC